MSGPSAAANVWSRLSGPSGASAPGAAQISSGGFNAGSLPVVNNSNLPSAGYGGAQQGGQIGNQNANTYNPGVLQNMNQAQTNALVSAVQASQNEANRRRISQLEDEIAQRRAATVNLQQMGTQLLQGQMDVQEQVLQYQFMLEQCMETLDQQNFVLNEQAEELALLRSKMRHFEYLIDALKLSKEGNKLSQGTTPGDSRCCDVEFNSCRDPLNLAAPSMSRFFTGVPTRATASTFQPFNPRYRSPNSRAAAAEDLERRRSVTPTSSYRKTTSSYQSTPSNSNVRDTIRRFETRK